MYRKIVNTLSGPRFSTFVNYRDLTLWIYRSLRRQKKKKWPPQHGSCSLTPAEKKTCSRNSNLFRPRQRTRSCAWRSHLRAYQHQNSVQLSEARTAYARHVLIPRLRCMTSWEAYAAKSSNAAKLLNPILKNRPANFYTGSFSEKVSLEKAHAAGRLTEDQQKFQRELLAGKIFQARNRSELLSLAQGLDAGSLTEEQFDACTAPQVERGTCRTQLDDPGVSMVSPCRLFASEAELAQWSKEARDKEEKAKADSLKAHKKAKRKARIERKRAARPLMGK